MLELGAALASWLESKGVTDDICGNSLRSAWLEVRPLRPEADPLPAAGGRRRSTAPEIAVVAEPEPSPEAGAVESARPAVAGVARPDHALARPAARRPSRWPLVLLWMAALTGLVAALTGWLGIPLSELPARLRAFWR
jgi:hypothetical protein